VFPYQASPTHEPQANKGLLGLATGQTSKQ
jgi:hypothetical protein